jgi:hypothetical protein
MTIRIAGKIVNAQPQETYILNGIFIHYFGERFHCIRVFKKARL